MRFEIQSFELADGGARAGMSMTMLRSIIFTRLRTAS